MEKFDELYAQNLNEYEGDATIAYICTLQELGYPVQRICVMVAKKFDEATAESLIDHLIEKEVLNELESHGVEV